MNQVLDLLKTLFSLFQIQSFSMFYIDFNDIKGIYFKKGMLTSLAVPKDFPFDVLRSFSKQLDKLYFAGGLQTEDLVKSGRFPTPNPALLVDF